MKYCLLVISLLFGYVVSGQEPKLILPIGHQGGIWSTKWSPDGTKIVTAAAGDKTVKIWDANTGLILGNINQEVEYASPVEFSNDNKKIVLIVKGVIKIWDVQAGRFTGEFKKKEASYFGYKLFRFSPDGKKIAGVLDGVNSIVTVWDFNSGKWLHDFVGGKFVSFSPDGRKIVIKENSYSGQASIWDVISGKLLNVLKKEHFAGVNFAEFSPDGKKVVTSSSDRTAKVWDAVSGLMLIDLKAHTQSVELAQFSSDGKKVVTVSKDTTVKIWDAVSGTLINSFITDWLSIKSAKLSPDGKKLATASSNIVNFFDAVSGLLLDTLESVQFTNSIPAIQFSPNGKKITTTTGDTVKIWDAATASLLVSLKGYTLKSISTNFSSDSKLLTVFVDGDKTAKIWDVFSGILLHTVNGARNGEKIRTVDALELSPDKKKIAMAYGWGQRIWDAASMKVLFDYRFTASFIRFSPDGRKVAMADFTKVSIANLDSGTLLTFMEKHTSAITGATFSSDGKKVVTVSRDNTAKIWDVESGSFLADLKGHIGEVFTAHFSPDGKHVVTASWDATVKIWDAESGMLLRSIIEKTASPYVAVKNTAQFSPDSKKIVANYSSDNSIAIWDARSGDVLSIFKGHTGIVKSAQFSPDGKQIVTLSDDRSCKLWDIKSNKLLCTFFATTNSGFFAGLPSGYYQCSPNAAKLLHYVTKDLKVITFEQLDVKYNRPDKVLEAIGNTDTALINSYRKAYQKRIKKLGIDTTQFKDGYSVPETDFTNREAIENEQAKDKLLLKIKGNDSSYKLDRFNVWVNEVPLFGLRGIQVKRKNNFDTTITITLSQGENRIETSVINTNGTESYKMPLFVKYTPTKPVEEKQYFIGIGINQFSNTDYNLNWSVKDIRDLALKLKTKYPNIIIDTLFDSNVTKENVLALKQKLLQLKEDDKVIVSYSGHGVLSKDFDYFLSTYSIDFSKPEEKGLAYDDLESLLDNIKPRKKLMLIDACHSGEVDKDEIAKIEASKTSLNNNGVTTKSTIKVVKKEKQLGMSNSFELMQSLFVNVGKGTGATIISAAGGMQYAQERGDLKNGVFTYSLIEAFNENSTLKVSELKKKVGERVTQLTNGLQKPTSRNETNNYDWVIW